MERTFIRNFGINKIVGSVLLIIISYIIFLNNIGFVTKVNSIIVPILILIILIIGIKNIVNLSTLNIEINLNKSNSIFWIVDAFIYASYNLILLIPVLISIRNFIKRQKQVIVMSMISGIIILVISILTFLLLVNMDTNSSNIEMPIIYVIKNKFNMFRYLYGMVILIAIFTTAISSGFSFLNNVSKDQKNFIVFSKLLCIASVVIIPIGFSNLVKVLFPIFGYIGLIQIYFIAKIK